MISLSELSAEVSEPIEVNVGTDENPKIVTIIYRPFATTPDLGDRFGRRSFHRLEACTG